MLGDQVGLVDGLGEAAGAGPGPGEEVGDAGAQRVGVLVSGLGGAGQGPGVGDGHARASSGTSAGPAGDVSPASAARCAPPAGPAWWGPVVCRSAGHSPRRTRRSSITVRSATSHDGASSRGSVATA